MACKWRICVAIPCAGVPYNQLASNRMTPLEMVHNYETEKLLKEWKKKAEDEKAAKEAQSEAKAEL